MNKFIGIGYIGNNPEIIDKGCKLSLCTTIWDGIKEKNIWLKVLVFGKSGENCIKHLEKGRRISIDGRVDISKLGNMIIVTDNVTFL